MTFTVNQILTEYRQYTDDITICSYNISNTLDSALGPNTKLIQQIIIIFFKKSKFVYYVM